MAMRQRLAVLGLLVLLSGCLTGKRPTISDDPFPAGASTGDASLDQLLVRLDATNEGPYTANYDILTKFGNTTHQAFVAVAPGRRSVTVGTVRFLTVAGSTQTCVLNGSGACSSTIDPARISDTQTTPDFYAADTAMRIRRVAPARIGPVVAHAETIAGQPASCADIPVSGGTSKFCALPNGPVAKVDDGAVAITMTYYSTTIDESLFTTTG
jgi:hypothetical protein